MTGRRLLVMMAALLLRDAPGTAQQAHAVVPVPPSLLAECPTQRPGAPVPPCLPPPPPGMVRPPDCPSPGSLAAAARPDCRPLPPPIQRSERPANQASGGSAGPIAGGLGSPLSASIRDPSEKRTRGGVHRPSLGTRFFVPAVAALPSGFGAVGVVAFPHPPVDAAERARDIAICRAYVTALPDSRDALAQAPDRPQMVTLWPRTDLATPLSVRAPVAADRAITLCETAIDNYAYVSADGWLADLPARVRLDPSARGPLLIAWAPAASRGDPRTPVLTFDLSSYDQLPTMVSAFGIWKREIESRPDLWKNGWDQTRWRLEAAARVDRYGAGILAALKLVPFLGGGGD